MIQEGTAAPAFNLDSDAGNKVKLADYKGKTLVVYFYPKDSTPGCTRESIAFSEALGRIAKAGASVVGISKDSVQSHKNFRDKYALKVALLSDPDLTVHKAFGAYGEKMMYGKKILGTIRSTFIVGPDGKIARVFPSVKVDGHVEKVLEALGGSAPKTAAKKAPAKKAAKTSGKA